MLLPNNVSISHDVTPDDDCFCSLISRQSSKCHKMSEVEALIHLSWIGFFYFEYDAQWNLNYNSL
jgi:hypothetical protein